MAAWIPRWASEVARRTPSRPRATSERRNAVQDAADSAAATAQPTTSRSPRSLTAMATRKAAFTMRPPSRTFSYWASSHRYG